MTLPAIVRCGRAVTAAGTMLCVMLPPEPPPRLRDCLEECGKLVYETP